MLPSILLPLLLMLMVVVLYLLIIPLHQFNLLLLFFFPFFLPLVVIVLALLFKSSLQFDSFPGVDAFFAFFVDSVVAVVVVIIVVVKVKVSVSGSMQDMKLSMSVYKYFIASVKEPTSLLRLLWSGSSAPWLDRPLHQHKTPNRVGLLLSRISDAPFTNRWDGANRYILMVRGKSDPYYPIAPTSQSHRRRSKAYPTLQRVMSARLWDPNSRSLALRAGTSGASGNQTRDSSLVRSVPTTKPHQLLLLLLLLFDKMYIIFGIRCFEISSSPPSTIVHDDDDDDIWKYGIEMIL